jgi:hypothetical protein
VTNNAGVFNGPGFDYGIDYSGGQPTNVVVSKVSVAGVLYYGINLNTAEAENATVVEDCTVQTVGASGIQAANVFRSTALIYGSYGIIANTASDCYGSATGSSYGIYVINAQNCYGVSTSGTGLYASSTNNCQGASNSSYGLNAQSAQNCYGNSVSSFGLYSNTANNCYGLSLGGPGLASSVAIGCYGYSGGTSGVGINATVANSCISSSGDGHITYPYNMP